VNYDRLVGRSKQTGRVGECVAEDHVHVHVQLLYPSVTVMVQQWRTSVEVEPVLLGLHTQTHGI